MTKNSLATILASLLVIVTVAPSALLVWPQRVHAIYTFETNPALVGSEPVTAAKTTISAIESVLIKISSATTAWAANANWVMTYILQPYAFIMSGKLIKAMTAGVIAFVIGQANGTGVPQFVVDVAKTMQHVSDGAALSYLRQVGNTHSPFSSSIASALNTEYLQKSSLKGFWDANLNTLYASSPNVPAYLSGNWTQGGGVVAWFALTTKVENNPYLLYSRVRSRLADNIGPGVGGDTGARSSELGWGQGFMSWCGENEKPTPNFLEQCAAAGGTPDQCQHELESLNTGVNPGDPCVNKDGTPGKIKTPGSLIKSTLDKVLGGQQDQIVRMGDVSGQINGILGNIATVLKTVNFATQLLGGGSGDSASGGLIAAGAPPSVGSSGARAALDALRGGSSLGVTQADVVKTASASQPDSSVTGAGMEERINQYTTAWGTIASAANTASTSVTSLASFCQEQADIATQRLQLSPGDATLQTFITKATAQVGLARTALAQITPVLNRAAQVPAFVAATAAQAAKVRAELASNDPAYAADLQKLFTMPPTQSDLSAALQDVQVTGATATPEGSLTVSGGGMVSQMNLISANANALKLSVCTLPITL